MATNRRLPGRATPIGIPGPLGTMLSNRLGRRPVAPPAVAPVKPGKRVPLGAVVSLPDSSESVLSSILDKAPRQSRVARTGLKIHVSDLISKCVRKKAIVEKHKVAMSVDRLSLTDSLTFRQGDAIHDVIKERAAAGAPSLVWGKWHCKCGSHKVETPCVLSQVDLTQICSYCETPADVYDEADFLDDELAIVGHPDLILYMPGINAFYVTELKSISPDAFKDLVRPKPEHVIQVLFYWWLMRRKGMRVVDTASILYVTKGYVFRGKPYIEFEIDVTENLNRLDNYIEDARAVLRSRKEGVLPPRVTCASRSSPDARACEVAHLCFDDPAAPKPIVVSYRQSLKR